MLRVRALIRILHHQAVTYRGLKHSLASHCTVWMRIIRRHTDRRRCSLRHLRGLLLRSLPMTHHLHASCYSFTPKIQQRLTHTPVTQTLDVRWTCSRSWLRRQQSCVHGKKRTSRRLVNTSWNKDYSRGKLVAGDVFIFWVIFLCGRTEISACPCGLGKSTPFCCISTQQYFIQEPKRCRVMSQSVTIWDLYSATYSNGQRRLKELHK